MEKWVQKEALVKATGRGLAEYSTRMFSVGVASLYDCLYSLSLCVEFDRDQITMTVWYMHTTTLWLRAALLHIPHTPSHR